MAMAGEKHLPVQIHGNLEKWFAHKQTNSNEGDVEMWGDDAYTGMHWRSLMSGLHLERCCAAQSTQRCLQSAI
jgi:hypothetical protein